MKAFKVFSIILALLTFGWSISGNDKGNGSDKRKFSAGAAWFTSSSRTSEVCFEASPQFGVSKSEVIAAYEQARSIWNQYLERFQSQHLFQTPSQFQIAPFGTLASSCTGQEDLKIYFGVIDERVRNAMPYFVNPVGFAFQEKYDAEQGWGKGFIWITEAGSIATIEGQRLPDWRKSNRLTGILLHELGHVLGLPEVEGTIMTPRLYDYLTHKTQQLPEEYWAEIDHFVNLATHEQKNIQRFSQSSLSHAVFQRLMGRPPQGKMLISITSNNLLLPSQLHLHIEDELSRKAVPISLTAPFKQDSSMSLELFKVALIQKETLLSISKSASPLVSLGYISQNNLSIPVIVIQNMGNGKWLGPLVVYAVIENKFEQIFATSSAKYEAVEDPMMQFLQNGFKKTNQRGEP